jgi:hypothetical protein
MELCYVRLSEILLPSTLDDASSSGGDDPSAKIWNLSLARTSEHDAAMMDEGAHRRRAVICSRAIWETSVKGISVHQA